MKQEIKYATPTETIKGYKDSVIAKSESNDCVVRAFASSFDLEYDNAHLFVADTFNRPFRKGVRHFYTIMSVLISIKKSLNGKTIKEKDLTELKTENKTKSATVGQFLKKYKTGTFLVVVRGHSFTIKNGVIIGNQEDAKQLRRPFTKVYEIV